MHWIVRVPSRPGSGGDTHEEYGIIEAATEALAVKFAAPIVRWDVGRLQASPCEDPSNWATVADRTRHDALKRMSPSLLNRKDRELLARVAGLRPLRRP